MKEKVFGIGLSRTGTTSLTEALSVLGYRSVHFPLSYEGIREYDAATDTTVALWYKRLDKDYPGSKFVLTIRDESSWLESMEWLFNKSCFFTGGSADWRKRVPWAVIEVNEKLYGTCEFDRGKLIEAYRKHYVDVLKYFEGRENDLLVMNIIKGDGWEKICPFLGKPVPDRSFPCVNRRG